MRTFDYVAVLLLVIGGLNWGLVGLFGFDLVAALFGDMTVLARVVYALVGVAAAYRLLAWRGAARRTAASAA
jgi:hypothetical protein